MPQVINTNILSLTAQRNLNNTQSALATAMQRLSSGLRINSAKDDAAGLAIATRFTTQINGLNTAVRNANDGISLAQTTGSALAEVTDNLQAIRTLAVQSANATNSSSDRSALDNEVQQRLAEITRIARQTTFNGRHVLDGNFGNAAFQVGANVGETITINLTQGTSAADIGGVATVSQDVSGAFSGAAATAASVDSAATVSSFNFANVPATASSVSYDSGSLDYSGGAVSFTVQTGSGTAETVSLNAAYANQGDLLTAVGSALGSDFAVTADGTTGFKISTVATGAGSAITVGGTDPGVTNSTGVDAVVNAKSFSIDSHAVTLSANDTNMAGLISDINGQLGAASSNYALSDDGGKLKIATVATGASAAVAVTGTDAAFFGTPVAGTDAGASVPLTLGAGDFSVNGTAITGTFADAQSLADGINAASIDGVSAYLDGSGNLAIQSNGADVTIAGAKAGAGTNDLGFSNVGTAVTASGSLSDANVQTVAGADDVINRVDAALTTISGVRSQLGAIQNRFDSTISNLQAISENLSASRSRIEDTDFAAETANLSRAQILQQAGVAMLAQANVAPQTVLKLLQ